MRRFSLLLVALYVLILIIGFIFFRGLDNSMSFRYRDSDLFFIAEKTVYASSQILGSNHVGYTLSDNNKEALSASESVIKNKIKEYDWNTDVAIAVAKNESHFFPDAYNPEWHDGCRGSYGVFQIGCIHGYSEEEMFDWERNIEIAYQIWKREGWRPWGVCHHPNRKVVCWL